MDADFDGAHISSLLINFFNRFWPELFEQGRIYKALTPILVAKNAKNTICFYSNSEYDEWLSKNVTLGLFDIKNADDYTSESLDGASANNKMDILSWWLENNRKYGLPLKYTEKSMIDASKFGLINILNWWYDSKLLLKYLKNILIYSIFL